VYPNSFGLKEIILKENFCKHSKLCVLANGSTNGINTNYFNPDLIAHSEKLNLKQSLNIVEDDFVFVFVGRLVKDKGVNELVKSFKKISSNYKHVKLLLVGSIESELDPLETTTLKTIECNDNILDVGYQNDVRPYFSCSDVLVFPSYREGFPNVVMQAGAMGLASIVTNINGCNEIIKNGKNGLIIPAKDTEALYEAMEKVIIDKRLRLTLQQCARQMIVNRYEQNEVWNAILNEYQDLEQNV